MSNEIRTDARLHIQILSFMYPIYNHNWRYISTIYVYMYIYRYIYKTNTDFEFYISYL